MNKINKKETFLILEKSIKRNIQYLKDNGETDEKEMSLYAISIIENLLKKKNIYSAFYEEILTDLITIYVFEPIKTYEIYKKYGIIK